MKDDIRLIYKCLVQSLGSYCLVLSAASFGTVPLLKSVDGPWLMQALLVLLGFTFAGVILARRPVWLVRPRNDTSGAAALALIAGATLVAIILGANLAFAVTSGGAYRAVALAMSFPPIILALVLGVLTPLHTVSNYLSWRSFYSGRVIRNDTYVRRVAQWPAVAVILGADREEDTQVIA